MTKPLTREKLSLAEWRRRHMPARPMKVLWDEAVTRFVDAGLKTMTFKQLARACRERFGPARAPSKSALNRYWIAFYRGGARAASSDKGGAALSVRSSSGALAASEVDKQRPPRKP